MISNIVPTMMRGKTAAIGKVPYEVLVFGSQEEWQRIMEPDIVDEKELKRKIVAKFNCYGHATLFAHQMNTAPFPPFGILLRA